jgi:hypothetical protein
MTLFHITTAVMAGLYSGPYSANVSVSGVGPLGCNEGDSISHYQVWIPHVPKLCSLLYNSNLQRDFSELHI